MLKAPLRQWHPLSSLLVGSRRFVSASPAKHRQTVSAGQDPIQRMFVEKIREFQAKQEVVGLEGFVEPSDQFLNDYRDAMQRIKRMHSVSEAEAMMVSFPEMTFPEPTVHVVRVEEETPLEEVDKLIEKEEKQVAGEYFPLPTVKMETKGYALDALAIDGNYHEPTVKEVVDDPTLLSTIDDEIMGADDFIIRKEHLVPFPKISDQKLIETPQSKDFELNF